MNNLYMQIYCILQKRQGDFIESAILNFMTLGKEQEIGDIN